MTEGTKTTYIKNAEPLKSADVGLYDVAKLAAKHLPEGWQKWVVEDCTKRHESGQLTHSGDAAICAGLMAGAKEPKAR